MKRHAKISDLPGWPCPPRVRDIPEVPDSWGWIRVAELPPSESSVATDELGFLWVLGDTVPVYRLPDETNHRPGGIVFHTPDGIGLYVHPKSYSQVPTASRLDHQPDQWLPVVEIVKDLPEWIRLP